jgi:hypothetical protein
MGESHTRFIFLMGGRLHHISERIDEGADSPGIASTLVSRLLLEMDQVNLPTVEHVILSGYAHAAGLQEPLAETLPESTVHPFDLLREESPFEADQFFFDPSEYAPAIGAAMRALDPGAKDLIQLDLTPTKVKEFQNKLMMSTPAWILLALIPLIAAGSLWKLDKDLERRSDLALELVKKRNEMQYLEELEASIAKAQQDLASYERSFAVIDSLMVGAERWTTLFDRLERTWERHGGFWITEIKSGTDEMEGWVTVNGYSVLRNRIPVLVDSLAPSRLVNVEAQEIREVRVYRFELDTRLSE